VDNSRAYELGRSGAFPVIEVGKYRRVRVSDVRAYIKGSERPAKRRQDAPGLRRVG